MLGMSNQNEILLSLGKAMSGPPTNNGSRKLPKPPIILGMRLLTYINNWTISSP